MINSHADFNLGIFYTLETDFLYLKLFFRSTGMAVTLAAGRLGAILGQLTFGYLIEVNCAIPIIIVASLLTSGGITGFFVPNTAGTELT